MRGLLMLDPLSTEGRLDNVVTEVVLLRLPQLVWLAAMVNLGFVWSYVATLLRPPLFPSRAKGIYAVVLSYVTGICCFCCCARLTLRVAMTLRALRCLPYQLALLRIRSWSH